MGSLLQRMDRWTRQAMPLVLTLAIVLVTVAPLRLPEYPSLAPAFVLTSVFYWVAHRPDLMTPPCVFAVGLLEDVLSGASMGLNALLLLVAHWAIMSQRKTLRGKSFMVVWLAFALVAAGYLVVQAAILFLVAGAWSGVTALLGELALAVALYPLPAWTLARAQRALLPA